MAIALATTGACGVATAGPSDAGAVEVRLGYFPNLTHAPALVGIEAGTFVEALGDGHTLTPRAFHSGTEAVTALFAGALDLAYIGPGPTTNAWQQSDGRAVRVIAGSTSGGAALVVREGIDAPEDLIGTRLATPARGNTQDIALRSWLAANGLTSDLEGGGEVSVLPQDAAQAFEAFRAGAIDGAWLPEPWATRLEVQAGGHVLVDERDLWPEGRFATTVVVARTDFLEQHPDLVERFLRGHVEALHLIRTDPAAARARSLDAMATVTGDRLDDAIVTRAWERLAFTHDPLVHTIEAVALAGASAGLLEPVELSGLTDLRLLERVLADTPARSPS